MIACSVEIRLASTYQIGTQPVAVEVCTATGARLAGEMFLRPAGVRAAETVAERLNDGAPFFPLRGADGSVALVGKALVRYVIAPSSEATDPTDEARAAEVDTTPHVLVTAELDSGEAITGVFLVDLPPERVRTLDYVNAAGHVFLPLAQLDREVVINRAFILQLRDVRT